jgi:hypothetical protein
MLLKITQHEEKKKASAWVCTGRTDSLKPTERNGNYICKGKVFPVTGRGGL